MDLILNAFPTASFELNAKFPGQLIRYLELIRELIRA
jgi:hypothetical protein